ncbi:UNVERIFIED_CONTAM: hypothetical protein Scaly_3147500 [Sesamum calycinum]|uniref:Uncharacterized protein n=1 Tax=Sesamum calycinum TaxID=2727403 RepID=A0AAW2JGR0_9LAMI
MLDKVKPNCYQCQCLSLGAPRIIPSFHRRLILRKDDRADILVQLYLSFFSLSKIIVLAKRVRKYFSFTSIISPVDDIEAVTEVVSDMKGCLKDLMLRYVPRVRDIPLYQGMSFDPTLQALPEHRLTREVLQKRAKHQSRRYFSPVLESAPSYAHVVASAATRNLRSPAMEKDLFVHALAVASAGSMGSQSKFPRFHQFYRYLSVKGSLRFLDARRKKRKNSLPSAKLQSLRADAATVDGPNGDSFLYEALG